MDITSYLLGKNAGGGGNTPSTYNAFIDTSLYTGTGSYSRCITTVDMAGLKPTTLKSAFSAWLKLANVLNLDSSEATTMAGCFQNTLITSFSTTNTSKCINFGSCFYGCSQLVTVPVLDFQKVIAPSMLQTMFTNCSALSDESLNNIMASCITATSYTGTKTLAELGLTQAQATTCATLSNYAAFTAAGWTTGY